MEARIPLKHSQWDVYSEQPHPHPRTNFCGLSFVAPLVLIIPGRPPAGPIHGFLPTLARLLASPPAVPWPVISECPGGCPSLSEEDLGCCGLRAIFAVLRVSVISGPWIGRAGEWECQALLRLPGVGAEGQRAVGCHVTWAGHSPSRPWSLGSEMKVTIKFSASTPSLWRNSHKIASVSSTVGPSCGRPGDTSVIVA